MFLVKFEKKEWELLWRFYLARFIFTCFLIFIPYWVVFFKENFSFTQVSILLAIMFFSPLIFEIPTGIFADLYGRKNSVIASYAIDVVTFFLIGITSNFYLLALYFVFFGLASSLESGAGNAWVVDKLIHKKRKDLQKVYFQKNAIISNIAFFLSGVIGLVTVRFLPFNYVWFFASFGMFAAMLVLLREKEDFKKTKKQKILEVYKEFIETFKKGVVYTKKNKDIRLLTLSMVIYIGGYSLSNISWEPELVNLGLPVYLLGTMILFMSTIGYLVASNYDKYTKKFGRKKVMIYGILFYSAIVLIATKIFNPFVFLFFFALKNSTYDSFLFPVYDDLFHESYTSKIRATMESIRNMVYGVGAALMTVMGGVLNDAFGPRTMILMTGIIVLLAITPIQILRAKNKKLSSAV
ncbi:MFS transporter [Candidatus Woesearchaeota archaeon]|nr:MFS transporter [Candidatus Woesearchaeota archaeon]